MFELPEDRGTPPWRRGCQPLVGRHGGLDAVDLTHEGYHWTVWVPSGAVTPLIHTFDGVSIQCMVGQCRHTLSLPEVFFEARGKVMEMKEHSRSRGLPAKLPEALL